MEQNTELMNLANQEFEDLKTMIQSLPENNEFRQANARLINAPGEENYPAMGTLKVTGFLSADVSCALIGTGKNTTTMIFEGEGSGIIAGGVGVLVTGNFYVDPATIQGSVYFQIVFISVAGGGTRFTLSNSHSGELYGSFVGAGVGLGLGSISGDGKLIKENS